MRQSRSAMALGTVWLPLVRSRTDPCLLSPCEAARMKPCGPLHFAVVPALTVERPGPLFSGSSTPARAGAAK